MTTLLEAVRRHADAQGIDGPIATPIPGLLVVRATSPSELMHDVQRPLVCLVQQGAKRVSAGARTVEFSAGDSLLVTADIPTVSQVTRASTAEPYYSLVLELDPALIVDLVAQMAPPPVADSAPRSPNRPRGWPGSWLRSRPREASTSARSPTTRRASCAGSSGSACTRCR